MPNLSDRITKVETITDIWIPEIKKDIKDIKSAVLPLPELMRKVNEHHKVFHEHVAVLDDLKSAGCPAQKVMPGDIEKPKNIRKNGKRKTDKYRYGLYALIVSILGLIMANMYTCSQVFQVMSDVTEQLSKVPK